MQRRLAGLFRKWPGEGLVMDHTMQDEMWCCIWHHNLFFRINVYAFPCSMYCDCEWERLVYEV